MKNARTSKMETKIKRVLIRTVFVLMVAAVFAVPNVSGDGQIQQVDFSPSAITINFDELQTPYPHQNYPAGHWYGDSIGNTYQSLGVFFGDDDRPVDSIGVGESSSPNAVVGGLPWDAAKEITITLNPPVIKAGAWTIDSGSGPADNEVSATFFDANGNIIGIVNADPYLIPSIQFLGFESSFGIAKVIFRELNRPGDFIDDFYIDDFIFEPVAPVIIPITIDIKPGSYPNSINPNSGGVIPVAILTTDDFDASSVNPETVALEGEGARGKGKSGRYGSMEDVDGDGDLDLVVQIENVIEWDPEATEATLTGETYDGIAIQGMDTVNIVPPE